MNYEDENLHHSIDWIGSNSDELSLYYGYENVCCSAYMYEGDVDSNDSDDNSSDEEDKYVSSLDHKSYKHYDISMNGYYNNGMLARIEISHHAR